MDTETIRGYVAENRELETQLTKRNQQYIFDLKKSLEAANLSEADRAAALHEILPVLVQEQKTGKTARQLFGTVSERTDAIINKPVVIPESTPVMMWLDNVLIIFALFTAMIGLMRLINKNQQGQDFGLLTLIVASLVGGYGFYLMYKYFYRYERPGVDKSDKPKWWLSMIKLIPVFFLWLFSFTLIQAFVPAIVNPVLDPFVMLVLGGLAFALRWYLKKKYNITGSMTIPR